MSQLRLVPRHDHKIRDAYDDFILSREAKLLSPKTITWYERTVGLFVEHLTENGLSEPENINPLHVRSFLTHHKERGLADASIHGFARVAKAFLKFLESEGYVERAPEFDMLRVTKEQKKILSPDDIKRLLIATRHGRNHVRDKALVLFLLDTGVRRSELSKLEWGDVNLKTGLVRIRAKNTKRRNFRTVMAGAQTRRVLLRHRRAVDHDVHDSVFGLRGDGIRQVLRRLEERTGVHATPHMFRHTAATLSLRNGMDIVSLQLMLGHSSLEVTRQYLQYTDEDLTEQHRKAGPVDRLLG